MSVIKTRLRKLEAKVKEMADRCPVCRRPQGRDTGVEFFGSDGIDQTARCGHCGRAMLRGGPKLYIDVDLERI